MSKIKKFPKVKKPYVFKDENCAGCHKPTSEVGSDVKLELPYSQVIEVISLCKECADESRAHGIIK